jgi:hypothetical protein
MGSEAESPNNEELLAQILGQFDEKDKQNLALQLVQSLKLVQYGQPYPIQVASILNRALTKEERFRLDVLDRILNFHGSGGGEEEEEE